MSIGFFRWLIGSRLLAVMDRWRVGQENRFPSGLPGNGWASVPWIPMETDSGPVVRSSDEPIKQASIPSAKQNHRCTGFASNYLNHKKLEVSQDMSSQDAIGQGNEPMNLFHESQGISNIFLVGQAGKNWGAAFPAALRTISPEFSSWVMPLGSGEQAQNGRNGEAMEVFLRQAKAYMRLEEWEKAIFACEQAIAIAPDIAEAHKLIGNILQEVGQGVDALGHYARALLAKPAFPEVYANLGSFYARQQDWEDAELYFRKAIDLSPDNAAFYRPLISVLNSAGKTNDAMEMLAQAVLSDPAASTALENYRVGSFLLEQEQEQKAITCFRHAADAEDSCVAAYLPLADLLEKQGDWQTATLYYRRAFEAGSIAEGRPEQSRLLAASGNSNGSESSGSESNGSGNGLAGVQQLAGQASVNPAAANPVRRIPARSRLQPGLLKQPNRRRVMGSAVENSGSSTSAISAAAPIGLIDNQNSDAGPNAGADFIRSAHGQVQEKNWPNAIASYQASLRANPNQPEIYRELARVFTQAGQIEEAALAWFESFKLEPDWATADQYLNLANNLVKQGKLEQATFCYEQAIRLKPEFSVAYENLGHVLELQNNPSGAAVAYRKALQAKGTVPVKK